MNTKSKPALASVLLLLAGCSDAGQPAAHAPEVSGRLEDTKIREASGLARSQRHPDVLWIINDNGAKEVIHAIDQAGARLGEFDLKKSRNRDWEDLASFQFDGKPFLMVADIGDNEAKHRHGTLYFVEEPQAPQEKASARVAWQIDFKYPDGPRDSESAAVDIKNRRILILSKRDIPPLLYAVPLSHNMGKEVTATWLGAIESLPRPTRQDVEFAPATKDWHWQPVGMDISQDNLAAVIMTYRAVYYYERRPDQDWFEALNGKPYRVSLGNFQNAEAIAFADDGRSIVVTGENKHSRVLRIDLNAASPQ